MIRLLIAFSVFIALHSVPAIPALRGRLIEKMGRRAYLIAYSVVSTLVLGWLFYEALQTDYIELWEPAPWQAWITLLLAPVGLFLVTAGLISQNPFSVTLRRQTDKVGAIVRFTRHPVLWGFFVWAIGHIAPNGDLRSLLLFGGFALFSLGGVAMQERRGRKRLGARWTIVSKGTSCVFRNPFNIRWDALARLAFALTVLTAALLLRGGHLETFGVDPMAMATG
ncbi:NnrU family protein [Rhizobium sp. TRM95796]|uniref:NnrU family protein n=1 Tax=Rhizobium sp. TRM95796 TaxID=2979862 RepID=UPI0021E7442D|nr:NnrU family protein [Rhizobium sp. TRM95796]MCV3768694.1 NnrU family protein [Rhizobium sp. TRM95796]